MVYRITLCATVLMSSLFLFAAIATAQAPNVSISGPANGTNVKPSTAIQKETEGRSYSGFRLEPGVASRQPSTIKGSPVAAGAPGVEGAPAPNPGDRTSSEAARKRAASFLHCGVTRQILTSLRPIENGEKMRRRTRTFIGTCVMFVFVPIYALVAMALAQARPVREASTIVQILCFAGLGLAWIAPMMPLIKWMERPDPGT